MSLPAPASVPPSSGPRRVRWPISTSRNIVALVLRPLLLPLLLLLCVALSVILAVNVGAESTRQVSAAQSRLNLITALSRDIASLENGQRGYILTGQDAFLEPYLMARQEFARHTTQLRTTSPIVRQKAGLAQVAALVGQWQQLAAEPEIQARRVSLQAAVDRVSDGQGKQLLDQARNVLATMAAREVQRQTDAIAQNRQALARTRLITVLGTLAGVLLLMLAAWRSARTVGTYLHELGQGAQQIADGNYTLRLPRAGVTEIDDLSRQFHQMAEAVQLRESALADSSSALQASNADLARSNRELERFAYVASHDLQEPLRTIGSYTELLARRYSGQLDERADKYIEFTIGATQRLKNLIQDLLTFSRVHRPGREFGPVDTAALVAEVQAELAAKIARAGATVEIGPLPTLRGNLELLHHIFLNLLVNAIKFRSPERPSQVWLSARRDGPDWLFEVRDNGIGIEPQYHERIFEVFQRLHAVGEYDGSGIGLAVTRSAVEQHGGRLWLESVPGQGTTFFVALPAEEREPT